MKQKHYLDNNIFLSSTTNLTTDYNIDLLNETPARIPCETLGKCDQTHQGFGKRTV